VITAGCLAVSGLVVAWLTPWLLRGQAARGDAPRLAVLAWFGGACGALVLWFTAAGHLLHDSGRLGQFAGAALGLALLGRLGWVVGRSLRRTRRQQRNHLAAAYIVGHRDLRPGVLVLDSDEPAVYCVPSGKGTVVMSRGAHDLLSEDEAQAVLVHERTHLSEHHHLFVTVATALHAAFGRLKLFGQMGSHVALLLEMRADDAAVRAYDRDTVIDALAALCLRGPPAGALAANGPSLVHRVHRLTEPASRWRSRIGVATTFATALLLAASPLLGPWLPFCPHPLV
jgi:Zn-dependent protease with chaperone function